MVETKEKENIDITPKERIQNACNVFTKVQGSGVEKFEKLDEWLERESALFLGESRKKNKTKYRYKKGTIIKVDFGVNIGSELCYTHFAIVLTHDDNINKDSLTVIPLTSKPGIGKVPLNNLIKNEVLIKIRKKMNNENITDKNKEELRQLKNYYKKYNEFSYAFISQITTISKSRIIFSKNKFDIINKVRCSNKLMNDIERELLKYITGSDIVGMLDEIIGEPI